MKSAAEVNNGFKETEIGLIPEDWEVKALGTLSEMVVPQRNKPKKFDGDTPWIRIEDFDGKYISDSKSNQRVSQETIKNMNLRPYPIGTVLCSCSGNMGICAITNKILISNQTFIGIIPHENLNAEYLYYLLSFSRNKITLMGTGVTIHYVSRDKFSAFKIPLPPLPEQQKIASVLSTIQEAKEKTENVIKATKELKKSMMKHLFTYGSVPVEETEKVPLKETEIGMIPEHWEVVKVVDVVNKTKQKNPENSPDWQFKYIDVSGINRETLAISDYKSYVGKDAPSRAKKLVETGDVIFATVRPTLKRVALIDEKYNGQICSTAFCVLRANRKKIIPFFIYHTVSRESFIDELGKIQRGASYPAVTDTDVKNQKIPLPSLNEQKQIADILSAIDNKIETEENKKQALDALFKTLLSLLMTGKIRVKDLET